MGVDVVVCNLTRFGDLLQSQAAIDDLHAAGRKVGLVCLDNFASAVPLLRNVAMTWKLPGAKLLAGTHGRWPGAVATLLDFAGDIAANGNPAHVLNLTPSLPARLLARLVANSGAQILGFGLDRHGYGVNNGVWSTFLAAAGARMNSPYNVADLFRKLAWPLTRALRGDSRLAPPCAEARDWAKNFLGAACQEKKPVGFIAFQLGASEERRRWPVENFCALGARLWDSGFMPVLLGSDSERHLAEKYTQAAAHPFVNAMGETDLMQLSALLCETRLLVTNDTGTMHLASGLGVPSLSFFLATAQPWDTGPQLPGCCCLEPDMPCHPCSFGQPCQTAGGCRAHIGPESATDLVLGWLATRDWRSGITPRVLREARVWVTGVGADGLASISSPAGNISGREIWLSALRIFWSQLLDEIDHGKFEHGAQLRINTDNSAAVKNLAARVTPALEQAKLLTASLAELGAVAARSAQARKLFLLNCERLQTTLDNEPLLGSMAGFWREARQSNGARLEDFLPVAQAFGEKCGQFARALSMSS